MPNKNRNNDSSDSEFIVDEQDATDEEGEEEISITSVLGEEDLILLDKFGVPKDIHHSPVYGAKADVWKFFLALEVPYQDFKKRKTAVAPKPFTHLCMLCLKEVNDLEKKTLTTWTMALCRPTNSTHASDHVKKIHKQCEEASLFVTNKKKVLIRK
jgi:hypothetical protein